MPVTASRYKKTAISLAKLSRALPGNLKLVLGGIILAIVIFAAFQPQFNQSEAPTTTDFQPVPTTSPDQLYAVDRVVDGDTIRILVNQQSVVIRMIGVNTPEAVDPRKPVQCFGQEASAYTKKQLEGQSVYVRADPTQDDHDKYNRLLRYVFLQDGTNFNQKLIADGYAYEYTFQIPYQMKDQFDQAENQAKLQQKGLWHVQACGE